MAVESGFSALALTRHNAKADSAKAEDEMCSSCSRRIDEREIGD